MKISSSGLQKIADRIKAICDKLNSMASLPKLHSEQREEFRELQEELSRRQREYRIFSNPDSGIK